jgi:hypothetical protein
MLKKISMVITITLAMIVLSAPAWCFDKAQRDSNHLFMLAKGGSGAGAGPGNGPGQGHGPGDGIGSGDGFQDGNGYGPGNC